MPAHFFVCLCASIYIFRFIILGMCVCVCVCVCVCEHLCVYMSACTPIHVCMPAGGQVHTTKHKYFLVHTKLTVALPLSPSPDKHKQKHKRTEHRSYSLSRLTCSTQTEHNFKQGRQKISLAEMNCTLPNATALTQTFSSLQVALRTGRSGEGENGWCSDDHRQTMRLKHQR